MTAAEEQALVARVAKLEATVVALDRVAASHQLQILMLLMHTHLPPEVLNEGAEIADIMMAGDGEPDAALQERYTAFMLRLKAESDKPDTKSIERVEQMLRLPWLSAPRRAELQTMLAKLQRGEAL